MRFTKNATKLVIAGLTVGFCALSQAQTGGGGTEVWTKVVNIEEIAALYPSSISVSGNEPFSSVDYYFPQVTHVWETINEDASLSAPWTGPIPDLVQCHQRGI